MTIGERTRQQYTKVFNNWRIEEGFYKQGSNGKTAVFKIVKRNEGFSETGALKVVNIYEVRAVDLEMFGDEIQKEIHEKKRIAEQELAAMNRMKGHANIVDYHEFLFEEYDTGQMHGVDLLIRMDFLDNVGTREDKENYIFSESEIVRMGIDLSKALVDCQKNGIIHRDIKPDNIFISNYGNYMLGDFGISKISEGYNNASTTAGTFPYAAPEQIGFIHIGKNSTKYDCRIDIYSLGLSLYELANGNNIPFESFGSKDEKNILRRLHGEPLPPLPRISPGLEKIILKACAYKPNDRYDSALDMLHDLEKYQLEQIKSLDSNMFGNVRQELGNKVDLDETFEAESSLVSILSNESISPIIDNSKLPNRDESRNQPKRIGKPYMVTIMIISLLCIALIFLGAYWHFSKITSQTESVENNPEVLNSNINETPELTENAGITDNALTMADLLVTDEDQITDENQTEEEHQLTEETLNAEDDQTLDDRLYASSVIPDRLELESNDEYDKATELTLDKVMSCTISDPEDVDFFKTIVTAPCKVCVELYPYYQEDVNILDAVLKIHTDNGTEVDSYQLSDSISDDAYSWRGKGMVGKRLILDVTHENLSIEVKYNGDENSFPLTQIKYWIVARINTS